MTGTDPLRRIPLAECRDCGLPMRFVLVTTTNRPMPVNARPDDRGNVAAHLEPHGRGYRLVGFVISKDRPATAQQRYRFMPHAATCEARKTSSTAKKPTPEPDPALF